MLLSHQTANLRSIFTMSMRRYYARYKCDGCGICVASKGNLDRHRDRFHSVVGKQQQRHCRQRKRRYTCYLCDVAFDNDEGLRLHCRIHEGDVDSPNDDDDNNKKKDKENRFANESIHVVVSSKETGISFSCHKCFASFPTKSGLKLHSQIHAGNGPIYPKNHECYF